ncbi:hypothetical protein ACVIWV_000156 [Bradyrhizobium diazoefficiens]
MENKMAYCWAITLPIYGSSMRLLMSVKTG